MHPAMRHLVAGQRFRQTRAVALLPLPSRADHVETVKQTTQPQRRTRVTHLGIDQQLTVLRASLQRQRSEMVRAPLVHVEQLAAGKVVGAEHVGLICVAEYVAPVGGKVGVRAVRNAAAMLMRKHQHARKRMHRARRLRQPRHRADVDLAVLPSHAHELAQMVVQLVHPFGMRQMLGKQLVRGLGKAALEQERHALVPDIEFPVRQRIAGRAMVCHRLRDIESARLDDPVRRCMQQIGNVHVTPRKTESFVCGLPTSL